MDHLSLLGDEQCPLSVEEDKVLSEVGEDSEDMVRLRTCRDPVGSGVDRTGNGAAILRRI
jgi:hypothetical protein